MKLENYEWMYCEKCGEKYTWTPSKGSNHKCKKSKIQELLKLLIYRKK
jgi:hypothetical protein